MNIIMLGYGFVGSYIKERFDSNKKINLKVLTKTIDRYDTPDFFIKSIKRYKPDLIINACGYTGRPNVDACESNKQTCWDLNVNLPVNIASICETYDIPFIHVSSGCIYTGYNKYYTEEDKPNFGLGSDDSSWYSKTKHACEIALKGTSSYILRIRMPFCSHDHERNILTKILNYNDLIEFENSMTGVEDFVTFIDKFIPKVMSSEILPGIFNVCNPGTITLRDIANKFKASGVGNSSWKFVDISQLELKANRSNCVLNTDKISQHGLKLPNINTSISSAIKNVAEHRLLTNYNI